MTGATDQKVAPPAFTGAFRQIWQVLTCFTGPHLSQRQLCPTYTFVLLAVLLVLSTLSGAPDQIGALPAFTGAFRQTWQVLYRLYRSSLITETIVSRGHLYSQQSYCSLDKKGTPESRQDRCSPRLYICHVPDRHSFS
jgi:hypothetical protein